MERKHRCYGSILSFRNSKEDCFTMASVFLVFLSLADIVLYTLRSYTNKLFAISYEGPSSMATPVFSAITGVSGFLFTVLLSGGMALPTGITVCCGIAAGGILFLYDLGNIRAAKTGPYSIQSMASMFGCVMLPLLFERLLWGVRLSGLQILGVIMILISFVSLNMSKKEDVRIKKGFYGWILLLFVANGIYSTILAAQQRWTGTEQRYQMIALVFLTMALVSVLYLIVGLKVRIRTAFCLPKRSWFYALASSAALTAAVNLLVILLGYIPASVLYPIQNSAILILLILLSAILLRENISRSIAVGILFALAGIFLLSL